MTFLQYFFLELSLQVNDVTQLIHVIIVIGRVFCFKNHENHNSKLKLSYSPFLLFNFISLVRGNSGDSGIPTNFDKDLFTG